MLWKIILSSMLFLHNPGQSIYSVVQVEKDDPPPCNEASIFCKAPWWSEAHQSYVVAENWEQGLKRYALIAKAIESVVKEKKWSSPPGHLWKLLVTVAFHESGFRRDVHSGIGRASRGDCLWQFKDGKPWKRIPGTCRSHCLTQVLYDGVDKVKGFTKKEIVGVNFKATKNCFMITALAMDSFYEGCSGNAQCMFMNYGGVKSLTSPKVKKRIDGRVSTFFKLKHSPKELNNKAIQILKE